MGGIPGALRSPRQVAVAIGATLLVALVVVGQLVDERAVDLRTITIGAAIGALFTPLATLILFARPGHLVGRLMFAAGALACASVLAASWASLLPLAWLAQWAGWPPLGLAVLALLVFPDGRLPSRRWLPLAAIVIGATSVAGIALAVAALDHPRTLIAVPEGTVPVPNDELTARAQALDTVAKVAILVVGACLVPILLSLWLRWRRSTADTRAQLACLLPAVALFPLALALDATHVTGAAWVFAAAAIPAAMTVAVLRYRLYALDRVINRGIVWLVMSVLVIVGFVALVALLRDLVAGGNTNNASLLATGLIAAAFEPVRRRVQRAVDHILYGDRGDPYKVIASVGELHGKTADPDAVLPTLTRTIAGSLQVPYVAVALPNGDTFAEHGTRDGLRVEEFDMVAHGEPLGQLLVGTRTLGARFTGRERRLLEDLAQYAAVVTEATRLIRDLQVSRGRIIAAREEERRRLRRDLHDGVGPALTGLSMQVRAAHKAVSNPARLGAILEGLGGDLRLCVSEVRQLLDELPRPPELDEGLVAALRAQCRRFDEETLTVDLHVADTVDKLPAAVEVAAYRIVSEALTNVAKHARARTCRITVDRGRALEIKIIDDGVGIGASGNGQSGVGLESMRERAAELGGECRVAKGTTGGTAVHVRLPMR
ncbi:ATP-binding protein [Actinomycetes bacterium KLBMP 9797]